MHACARAYSRLWHKHDARQRRQPFASSNGILVDVFSRRFSREALRNICATAQSARLFFLHFTPSPALRSFFIGSRSYLYLVSAHQASEKRGDGVRFDRFRFPARAGVAASRVPVPRATRYSGRSNFSAPCSCASPSRPIPT